MEKNKTNYFYMGFFILLLLISIISITKMANYRQKLKQEKTYNNQIHIADSLKNAQEQEKLEKAIYLYKDSLSNEKIKLIIQKNAKDNKKINDLRKSIPTTSSAIRDSIWSASWNSKDTLLQR